MSQKIHFVGVGGSGISGVARLAEKSGFSVTGCDLEESSAYGTNIVKGHSPSHLEDSDMVVTSPALFYTKDKNPEIEAARKSGKLITWQKFVADYLSVDKTVICIAGTHGKSTTTAMVGTVLMDAGLDPTVVIGANVPEWGGNFRYGEGKYIIIEADEFNDNFLNYRPDIIVLTNIEFDHPDYFKDEGAVRDSFDKFVNNLKGDKILITRKDSTHKKFNLTVFGEHNQSNANLAFVLGKKLGIGDDQIARSLEGFSGIGRRMELVADRGGIKVFDDYAHHPTAIKTTLEGLKERFPKARILVIDEPHGYKRTKALLTKYKGIFDSVDKVIIGPIFKARDEVDGSVTPELVANISNHKNAIGFDNFEKLIVNCKLEIVNSNYEVIVVMGAGKSYLWAREISELLPVKFSDLTTFKVGGKIQKYIEIADKNNIPSILKDVKKSGLRLFILGGGSDILVSDKEFDGVVIKFIGKKINVEGATLTAEAGCEWDTVVATSIENDLSGIECLSGIPGTMGAAPIQNIGAYGQELKETFISLEAYDIDKGVFVNFTNEDCKFGYRESVFKTKDYWQKYIIISVTLKLVKNGKPLVVYDSLQKYLDENEIPNPTLKQVREAVLKIRSGKFENPKLVGNAGSFFKNPIVSSQMAEELRNEYPDLKVFPFGNGFKVAAGWLIEKAGWKGKTYKTAGVSPNHALILINPNGDAKAQDVRELSEKIISDVESKFNVKLEREVQLINF